VLRFLFSLTVLLLTACQSSPPPARKNAAARPEGTSAAHSPPLQDDGRPVIVAFGDSRTAGYGVEPGKSFPDFLQRKLDEQGYSYRVVNEGISGDTSSAGLLRVDTVIAHHPAIVIVSFGGNDGLRGLPVEAMEENLREIITRLQQAGAKVVLAGLTLPPNYGSEYVRSFEAVYPRVAKQLHTALIPFLLEGVAARPELLADDIHPNAKGNEIVAGVVMDALEPLLEKESSSSKQKPASSDRRSRLSGTGVPAGPWSFYIL
jgi:acyl-CoA thioesterase-1